MSIKFITATEAVAQGMEVSAMLSISKWYKKRMREYDDQKIEVPKWVRFGYAHARKVAQEMIDLGAEYPGSVKK